MECLLKLALKAILTALILSLGAGQMGSGEGETRFPVITAKIYWHSQDGASLRISNNVLSASVHFHWYCFGHKGQRLSLFQSHGE